MNTINSIGSVDRKYSQNYRKFQNPIRNKSCSPIKPERIQNVSKKKDLSFGSIFLGLFK